MPETTDEQQVPPGPCSQPLCTLWEGHSESHIGERPGDADCGQPGCIDCEQRYRQPQPQPEGWVENDDAPTHQIANYSEILSSYLNSNNTPTPPSPAPPPNRVVFSNLSADQDTPWDAPSLGCYWCGRYGTEGSPLFTDEEWIVCPVHTVSCVECAAPTAYPHRFCAAHAGGERVRCASCSEGTVRELTIYSDYHGGAVCEDCIPGRCTGCDYETSYLEDGYCEDCYPNRNAELPSIENREVEEETNVLEADLIIPLIPGRENVRRVGIEIEGGGSWRSLGAALFARGLTPHAELGSYHEQTSMGSDSRFWSLERDSSVDWELVSPPLNIANRTDIRQLRQALQIIQAQIKSKEVWLDLRCGLHIHVGAEKAGIAHAWRLGVIWGFMEDLIFRLGAAKWPMHRAVTNGLHYCQPTPKGAKTKLAFGRQMDNEMDRYNALSFQNYISSFTRNCTCGAVRYDSWDECECRLGKCTFEFRVFNTSANMHKIHAYMALCQAMVAWATSEQEVDADKFDDHAFVNKHFDDINDEAQAALILGWQDGLSFIFNELPLTKGERLNLIYCIENSEVNAVGEDFIRALNITTTEEVAIA